MSLSNVISIASTATPLPHYALIQRDDTLASLGGYVGRGANIISTPSVTVNTIPPTTARLPLTNTGLYLITALTSGMSISGDTIVVAETGVYEMYSSMYIKSSLSGASAACQMIVNGAIVTTSYSRDILSNGNPISMVWGGLLTAGDVVDFRIRVNGSSSLDVYNYMINLKHI